MVKTINTDNIELAKREIKKTKEKPIIIVAQNDHFNRKLIEYGKFDIMLSIEKGKREDKLKQMDSGFNHILAKEASKNKIALGIDIGEIRNLDTKERAGTLSRIAQNIRIARKKNVRILLLNFKDKKDVISLFSSLGASSRQSSEAVDF